MYKKIVKSFKGTSINSNFRILFPYWGNKKGVLKYNIGVYRSFINQSHSFYMLGLWLIVFSSFGQGIPKDSSVIVDWAKTCTVERGWITVANTALGVASLGEAKDAIGKSDGYVISLGDGGVATLVFDPPINNGTGADFAVYENAFSSVDNPNLVFAELAHIEVSDDGVSFYRFPSYFGAFNLTQTGAYDYTDKSMIRNLAGIHKNGVGTPFDLEELKTIAGLDLNHITHVKIIDAVGSIDAKFSSYDAQGNIINDPWPTPFSSCGFDLDAVGVIHSGAITSNAMLIPNQFQIYPNPANNVEEVTLQLPDQNVDWNITCINTFGTEMPIFINKINGAYKLNVSHLSSGIYLFRVKSISKQNVIKLNIK